MAILEPLLILFTLLALLTASYIRPQRAGNRHPSQAPSTPYPLLPTPCPSRPARPPHGPHQDHRHLSPPRNRLAALGSRRISPPPLPSSQPSRRRPRRRHLAQLLPLHRPPPLPPRLPLSLRAPTPTPASPRPTASSSSPTPSPTAYGSATSSTPSLSSPSSSVFLLRPRLLRNPLVPALLLWAGGYAAFLAYHNNLQPRYYLVIAVPLTLLVPIVFSSLWSSDSRAPRNAAQHLSRTASPSSTIVAVLAVAHRHRRPPDPPLRPHPRLHLHQRRRPDPPHHLRRPHPQPAHPLHQRLPSLAHDRPALHLRRLRHHGSPRSRPGLPPRLVRHLEPGRRRQDGRPHPHLPPPARRRLSRHGRPRAQPPHPLPPRPRHPQHRPAHAATANPSSPASSKPASASSPALPGSSINFAVVALLPLPVRHPDLAPPTPLHLSS